MDWKLEEQGEVPPPVELELVEQLVRLLLVEQEAAERPVEPLREEQVSVVRPVERARVDRPEPLPLGLAFGQLMEEVVPSAHAFLGEPRDTSPSHEFLSLRALPRSRS